MSLRLSWLVAAVSIIVVVAVLVAYFLAGGAGQSIGPESLAGRRAPSFTIESLGGAPVSLSEYRGKIVVMNLWASWCPPCRAEMPDLERLYLAEHSRGVVVLGVDQGEAPQRAAAFARALGITYPVMIDESQRYGRVYAALGLPTTIVVDRAGVVVRGFDGPLTYPQMQAAIAPLVASR